MGARPPFDEPAEGGTGPRLDARTDVSGDTGKHGEVPATIGPVELKDEFSDPTVDITHERLTAEHEVVEGHTTYTDNGVDFVVQTMGRMPPEISITCWVTQSQLPAIENLLQNDEVRIETARYIGSTVPKDVDVEYSRTYHSTHGWIFETEITLFATEPASLGVDSSPLLSMLQQE
mgnify:CR=1 FL=1